MTDGQGFMSTVDDKVKQNSGWVIALGILLILLGIGAWFVPIATTLGVTVILGVILIVGGALHAIHAFFTGKFGTFIWQFLLGIVYVIAGIFLLNAPVRGSVFLTIVLAAFLLVVGIVRMVQGISQPMMQDRGWVITAGVLDILLAILIMAVLPTGGLWVIGVAVGAELIVAGITAIMAGVNIRHLTTRPATNAA